MRAYIVGKMLFCMKRRPTPWIAKFIQSLVLTSYVTLPSEGPLPGNKGHPLYKLGPQRIFSF